MTIDSKALTAMLTCISDWCVEHKLGTGRCEHSPEETVNDSIFINGNFARVLICTYELTGESLYLLEAIRWCDYFTGTAANPVKTSRKNDALWWWDVGNHNLYLADTGTAVHALFKAYPYVDDARRKTYLDALQKFYLLIAEGTDCDPMQRGQLPSPGWIINTGPDAGAIAVGYRHGKLDQAPYTISTATAGAQTCTLLYHLTGDTRYRETAKNAAMWLLGEIDERGTLPYRIHGTVEEAYTFQALHYALEGLLTAWLYLNDADYNTRLMAVSPSILDFVLATQHADGYWGTEREYDAQRAIFLPHFLYWYHAHVNPDSRAAEGADRFAAYVLNPQNTARYGIPDLVRVSGFIGLVFSGRLYPELQLCHPLDPIPLLDYSMDDLRRTAAQWTIASERDQEPPTRLD